jgi:hypothetical protein
VLYHEADLTIAVHHTDGGGVSDHVFARWGAISPGCASCSATARGASVT